MPDGRQGLNNFLYPRFRDRLLLGNFGNLTTNTASQNLKICYLNAGVGTNYIFTGGGGAGAAASGYAWNPAATGNDVPATYAAYGITAFAHVPVSHRTMFGSNIGANFGGGANTSTLTGVGVTWNGVLYADNVTVYAVTAGTMVSAFVMYQYNRINAGGAAGDTAVEDINSPLIAFFDSAIGMPVSGNGGDITVVWDSGYNRIFKI
jgi:hypothetical protein